MEKQLAEMFRLINLLDSDWKSKVFNFPRRYGFLPPGGFSDLLATENLSALSAELSAQGIVAMTFMSDSHVQWIYFCNQGRLTNFDYSYHDWKEYCPLYSHELTLDLRSGRVCSMKSPVIQEYVSLLEKLNVPVEPQNRVISVLFSKVNQ